jgi:hypothetical protein
MKHPAHLLVVAITLSGIASASPPKSCPIPGELLHWQADYCLFKTGTDDIIAAGPCLERESQIRFRSPCNGKFRYKSALCELVIGAGQRSGSIDSCVKDPLFIGPTVRNGGA